VLQASVDEYILNNVHVKKQAYANALDRMVQNLQAKPVKHNSSSVNMAQVLSLLRWFASMKRKNMYERLLEKAPPEDEARRTEQRAV
jgi:hypothetical protein